MRGWLTYRSFLNELLSILKMSCNVVNQSCSLHFIQNFAPKRRHLRSGNAKQAITRHKCLFLVNSSQYLLQITVKTFKKSFNFFSGWLCHFKGLCTQVCPKFIGWNFHPWRDDNSPIGGVISDTTSDTAYVNHFLPREYEIWSKSIQVKQGRCALLLKLVSLAFKNSWKGDL